jgi:hypothetical protein
VHLFGPVGKAIAEIGLSGRKAIEKEIILYLKEPKYSKH